MYRLKIVNGIPFVIDMQDIAVPSAKVHQINSPSTPQYTENGTIWEITGPVTAEISVGGKGYTVPVA